MTSHQKSSIRNAELADVAPKQSPAQTAIAASIGNASVSTEILMLWRHTQTGLVTQLPTTPSTCG